MSTVLFDVGETLVDETRAYETLADAVGVPRLTFFGVLGFARVAAEAGRDPADVAYVGDRVDFDVLPSLAAGLVAVHIRRGPWGYLQPGREQAHIRIDSLEELPGALADA